MKRWLLAALLAPLAVTVALAADGTLSSDEWKKVEAEVAAAAGAKDEAKFRSALARVGEDGGLRAYKFLLKVMGSYPGDLTAPAETMQVLIKDAKVIKEVRKEALSNKNPRVKAALATSLRGDDAENVPVLEKLLLDTNEDVAIAAVRGLHLAADAGVEKLCERMEKLDAAKGPIWEELRHALTDLLGMKLWSGAEYKARWMDVKDKGGTKAAQASGEKTETGKGAAGGGGKTVSLFGREVACSRVVFVLDTSGSMTAVDNPNLELPPDGGGTRGKAEPPKSGEKPGPDPRSRMERAKRELVKVLKGLPKTTHVNIVTFSTGTRLWRPGADGVPAKLHPLDDATRADAVKWVEALGPGGATATDDGLIQGFSVEGARCMYLLSDGAPSKNGKDRIPTEAILDLIKERNGIKKIRIHTLGFVGSDREFMKAVAKIGMGEYSDIK